MRESTIERKVCVTAKRLGWEVRKITSPSHRGMPDRLFYRYGQAMFVEFKAPGKKPTKTQHRELKKLREHNFVAVVIDDVDAGRAFFERYK
jgi:Holliday junction resolvase